MIPDQKMDTFLNYAITGTPTTFIVSSEGKILESFTGSRDLEFWKTTVDTLLKEGTQ